MITDDAPTPRRESERPMNKAAVPVLYAIALLLVDELIKVFLRSRRRHDR